MDGPYDRAVTLLPELGEFEPTLAVFLNVPGTLVCILAGDTTETTFVFTSSDLGLIKLRVKQVVGFKLGAYNQFYDDKWKPVPAIVGLY